VRQLRLVRKSLRGLRKTGNMPIGLVTRAHDERLSVRVFPGNRIEGILFKHVTVDARMLMGIDERALVETSPLSRYKVPQTSTKSRELCQTFHT